MAKIRPIKRSFNAGILSPVMYGQVDFDKWASAVKYMKNFIPLPQGARASPRRDAIRRFSKKQQRPSLVSIISV